MKCRNLAAAPVKHLDEPGFRIGGIEKEGWRRMQRLLRRACQVDRHDVSATTGPAASEHVPAGRAPLPHRRAEDRHGVGLHRVGGPRLAG